MCMAFGCNPQIIFCHFFRSLNFVIFGSTSVKTYRGSSIIQLNFSPGKSDSRHVLNI